MVDKIQLISNKHVIVSYSFMNEGLFITDVKTSKIKTFGYEGIHDRFSIFWNSFSEEVQFRDAVDFFKLNGSFTIYKI